MSTKRKWIRSGSEISVRNLILHKTKIVNTLIPEFNDFIEMWEKMIIDRKELKIKWIPEIAEIIKNSKKVSSKLIKLNQLSSSKRKIQLPTYKKKRKKSKMELKEDKEKELHQQEELVLLNRKISKLQDKISELQDEIDVEKVNQRS